MHIAVKDIDKVNNINGCKYLPTVFSATLAAVFIFSKSVCLLGVEYNFVMVWFIFWPATLVSFSGSPSFSDEEWITWISLPFFLDSFSFEGSFEVSFAGTLGVSFTGSFGGTLW